MLGKIPEKTAREGRVPGVWGSWMGAGHLPVGLHCTVQPLAGCGAPVWGVCSIQEQPGVAGLGDNSHFQAEAG